MKTRKSFVTNSSSSSFIIAIKQDVLFDEIHSVLKKEIDKILIDLSYFTDDMEYDDIEECISNVTVQLIKQSKQLYLGDWQAGCGYCSNEGDLEDAIVYSLNEIDTDIVKFNTWM